MRRSGFRAALPRAGAAAFAQSFERYWISKVVALPKQGGLMREAPDMQRIAEGARESRQGRTEVNGAGLYQLG
jgi:hypothetical protein